MWYYIGKEKRQLLETTNMPNLQQVLSQQPLGLVFDIDGTLSPIAPTPGEARLYPGVRSLLEQAREYAHIAIMTGRAIDDGAAMINLDGLTYIGSHGLECSNGLPGQHPVQVAPEALAYISPGNVLLDLTIHYRLCPDPELARQRILSLLEEPARRLGMRLDQEKQAIEIRTPLAVNKGQALLWFALLYELRGVIFAGDDRTDLDAVMEIGRLRGQQGLAALAVVVQHNDTPPALLEHADMIVQSVTGMAELLRNMLAYLRGETH